MKISSVGAELFHADSETDGQSDPKLVVDFRNSANSPKNCFLKPQLGAYVTENTVLVITPIIFSDNNGT